MDNKQWIFVLVAVIVIGIGAWLFAGVGKPNADDSSNQGSQQYGEEMEQLSPEEEAAQKERGEIARDISGEPTVNATFAHVKPGEYSEVYAVVQHAEPSASVTAVLYKEHDDNGLVTTTKIAEKTVEADQEGNARFTFRITEYGSYVVRAGTTIGSTSFGTDATVEVK